jgi:hypothetical protein
MTPTCSPTLACIALLFTLAACGRRAPDSSTPDAGAAHGTGCEVAECHGNAPHETFLALRETANKAQRECKAGKAGQVFVLLRVGADGRICSANVDESTVASGETEQCVVNQFRAVRTVARPTSSKNPTPCLDARVDVTFE